MASLFTQDENFYDTPDTQTVSNQVVVAKDSAEKSLFDIPDQIVKISNVNDNTYGYLQQIEQFEPINTVDPIYLQPDTIVLDLRPELNGYTITLNIISTSSFFINWGDGTFTNGSQFTTVYTKVYNSARWGRMVSISSGQISLPLPITSFEIIGSNDLVGVYCTSNIRLQTLKVKNCGIANVIKATDQSLIQLMEIDNCGNNSSSFQIGGIFNNTTITFKNLNVTATPSIMPYSVSGPITLNYTNLSNFPYGSLIYQETDGFILPFMQPGSTGVINITNVSPAVLPNTSYNNLIASGKWTINVV